MPDTCRVGATFLVFARFPVYTLNFPEASYRLFSPAGSIPTEVAHTVDDGGGGGGGGSSEERAVLFEFLK